MGEYRYKKGLERISKRPPSPLPFREKKYSRLRLMELIYLGVVGGEWRVVLLIPVRSEKFFSRVLRNVDLGL